MRQEILPEDQGLYRALGEAGLPATDKNIDTVLALLRNHLPVNKQMLHRILGILYQHPELKPEDLAAMLKNNIPLTEENVLQLIQYKTDSYQLTNQMKEFANRLPEFLLQCEKQGGKECVTDLIISLTEGVAKENLVAWLSDAKSVETLLSEPKFRESLQQAFLMDVTIQPETFSKEVLQKVQEQLQNKIRVCKTHAENTGITFPAVEKSGETIQNNMQFIQSVNQNLIFAQLPLSFGGEIKQGELYVLGNRKSVKNTDGRIKLLIHLEMEYLGEVSVMIQVVQKQLQLDFTVERDAISILEEHIDDLKIRLEEKGYLVQAAIEEKKQPMDFVEDFLCQEKEAEEIQRYAFDMRI